MYRKMELKTSDFNKNPTMIAAETFENILFQIRNSNLNFKLDLSPFAANISLKKSLVKDKSGVFLLPRANAASDSIAILEEKNQQLENKLFSVKNEFSSKVNECGTAVNKELENSRELVKKLQLLNANLVRENEMFKNKVKDQETEIKDLEHSNNIRKEVSDELNKKLSELKAKYDKERRDVTNQNKAEVRYWRKELGKETKLKLKLREMLENRGMDEKCEIDKKTKKKLPKKETLSPPLRPENEILCSICASPIPSYTPDYFCGEKFNPACHRCKDKNSSEDPFASFASTPPPSLVSHWLLPPHETLPQNPGSISFMVAHCVRFPNPGDSFISIEEALQMMRTEMELQRAEMKNWISQLMAPLQKLEFEDD